MSKLTFLSGKASLGTVIVIVSGNVSSFLPTNENITASLNNHPDQGHEGPSEDHPEAVLRGPRGLQGQPADDPRGPRGGGASA